MNKDQPGLYTPIRPGQRPVHPLQSPAWLEVYPDSEMIDVDGLPTLVRFGSNPLNNRAFAIVTRPGRAGIDMASWLPKLVESAYESKNDLSHISIEPDGRFLGRDECPPGLQRSDEIPHTARYTVCNDLQGDEEHLLSLASKSHRQNTRKALKNGLSVEVHSSGEEPLLRFLAVISSMQTSKSFVQFSPEHLRRVWESLSSTESAYITIGTYDGQDAGAYLVAHNGETAYQFYGGRTQLGRDKKLAQAIAFKTMVAAKEFGCTEYDMWGIGRFDDNGLDKRDEKYGIAQFKTSFGGAMIDHGANLLHIYDSKAYQAYKRGKKLSRLKLRIHKKLKR